ncbi:MAG: hypothetical protein GY938_05055 [Ketobacter sp.]|nr:hypothetical protein [Ketobacter sp.]
MGCFDSGESTSSVKMPKWLQQAAQENIRRATDIADTPYTPYEGDRLAGFTGDQEQSFDMMRGYGSQFMAPSGRSDMIEGAAGADIMQYDMPRLIDDIPGMGDAAGSIQDYMNPYIQSVLNDTLGEMNRQAGVDKLNIDRGATMAGAFGDAGHGIERSEHQRNVTQAKGQQTNRALADAFGQAMGMRESDLNRGLQTFQTNAGQYEGGLDRMISGMGQASNVEGNDLNNFMKYIGGLSGMGSQQQEQDQAGMDLQYGDFLRQLGYPAEMLDILNKTTAMQPHGTSTTTPAPSKGSQALGTGMALASLFI